MANFKAPLKLHISGESTPTTNLLVLNEVVIDRGNFLIISTEFEKTTFQNEKKKMKKKNSTDHKNSIKRIWTFSLRNFKVVIRL